MTHLLSVIMTAYNSERHLGESVESILGQTFDDFELIVVCDPSTDNSLQVLHSFKDTRLRVISPDRRIGRIPSLNLALNTAQGQLVAVQDADDISEPNRFADQVRYMANHPDIALLATWWEEIDDDSNHLRFREVPVEHMDIVNISVFENPIIHSSVMYRRSVVMGLGGYPPDFPHGEDFALWLKVMREHEVAIIPDVLVKFRMHQDQLTQSGKVNSIIAEEEWRLLQLAISHPRVSEKLRMKGLAMSDLTRSYLHSRHSQRAQALKWLARFMLRYPQEWLVSFRCWKTIGGILMGKTARDFVVKSTRRIIASRDRTVH